MILEHFSYSPLKPPRDFEQFGTFSDYKKPSGLWVSVRGEDDWLSWCKSEGFNIPDGFRCRTLVHLAPDANILVIPSVEEIDAFDAKYSIPDPHLAHALGPLPKGYERFRSPDWKKVAEDYDGIIIAPYLWERRLSFECNWYYGWDCASGCIWKARAIARFEEIDPPIINLEKEEAA